MYHQIKPNSEAPIEENLHLPSENGSRALLLGEEVLGLFPPIEFEKINFRGRFTFL